MHGLRHPGGNDRPRPPRTVAPTADFRIAGMKVARQSHRGSGRTAAHADAGIFEPRPPDDPDSALAFSTEGYEGHPPPPLLPRFWSPGWNSPQALVKFQEEVFGPLRGGDPGVCLVEACEVDRLLLAGMKRNCWSCRSITSSVPRS